MKQFLLTLSMLLATCHIVHGQNSASQPAASLGAPKASLGLPRPSGSYSSLVPIQFSDSAQPASLSVPPPDPVFPLPNRSADAPRQMPKPDDVLGNPQSLIAAPQPASPTPLLPVPSPKPATPSPQQPAGPSPGTSGAGNAGPFGYPPGAAVPAGVAAPAGAAPVGPSGLPACDECPDNLCPLPLAAAPLVGNRLRLSAEYLMWWTSGYRTPPLATTGPAMSDGILGQPGVSTLAGGDRSPLLQSGARFGFEYYFGPRQVWGIDGHFFFLGSNSSNQTLGSDQFPVLARPFYNVNQNIQFSEIVASPGVVDGAVNIRSSTSLWGADINIRRRLFDGSSWYLDAFGGYRYLNLTDDLSIQESVRLPPGGTTSPVIPPNFVSASAYDSFRTTNQFNGSQVGLDFEGTVGRWVFGIRPSIAIGETSSTLAINGGQTSVYTNAVVSTPSGLYALNSNTGVYNKNSFAYVPEVTLNIGYNVTDHLRLFVGYNCLYWSSVLRPGNQINTNLDVNRIPGFPAAPAVSAVAPTPSLRDESFWAQGINFGLMYRW